MREPKKHNKHSSVCLCKLLDFADSSRRISVVYDNQSFHLQHKVSDALLLVYFSDRFSGAQEV